MVNQKSEENVLSPQEAFFYSVYNGDVGNADMSLKYLGADIDGVEIKTGLSALHIAVGHNNVELVRLLLDGKAAVRPDGRGRWPSTIAALCEANGEICDLIADAEKALGDV